MESIKRIFGILPAVVLLTMLAGCSKSSQQQATEFGPPKGSTAPRKAAKSLSDLAERRKSLTSYQMTTETDGHKVTQVLKMKDGIPIKMKMVMSDNSGWMITLFDKKIQYMYNPTTKTAIKIDLSAQAEPNTNEQGPNMPKIPKIEDLEKAQLKNDTVDGIECWLLEVPGLGVKSWVEKEYGLPIQESAGGKIVKHKYSKINSVPDNEFELPAGTKVQEISQMMRGIPQPPAPPK